MYKAFLTALHEVFHESVKIKGNILEEAKQVGYPRTKLVKMGAALIISLDVDGIKLHPYFKNDLPCFKKVSDYIIFYPNKKGFFIFLCELKSNRPESAFKQLLVSQEFIKFILSLMYVCKKTFLKEEEIKIRGLVFSKKPPKTFTNIKKEIAYKIKGKLKYKHLKAGIDCNLNRHCQ